MIGLLYYFGAQVLILIALLIYGRSRKRHGEVDTALAHWTRTSEVFIDPTTSRTMRVWLDETDQRKYIAE